MQHRYTSDTYIFASSGCLLIYAPKSNEGLARDGNTRLGAGCPGALGPLGPSGSDCYSLPMKNGMILGIPILGKPLISMVDI